MSKLLGKNLDLVPKQVTGLLQLLKDDTHVAI